MRFITCTIAISSAANTSTRANCAIPSHISATQPNQIKQSQHSTLRSSYQLNPYWQVSSCVPVDLGVYAAELAGILAVGSYLGVTSIGTVPLSHLSTQIVMEINEIAYQGRALLQLYKPIVTFILQGQATPIFSTKRCGADLLLRYCHQKAPRVLRQWIYRSRNPDAITADTNDP